MALGIKREDVPTGPPQAPLSDLLRQVETTLTELSAKHAALEKATAAAASAGQAYDQAVEAAGAAQAALDAEISRLLPKAASGRVRLA